MTESHSQNSALWIAYHDYKMLIYEKGHHFNVPHQIPNTKVSSQRILVKAAQR